MDQADQTLVKAAKDNKRYMITTTNLRMIGYEIGNHTYDLVRFPYQKGSELSDDEKFILRAAQSSLKIIFGRAFGDFFIPIKYKREVII